jgi:UDP-N-acetylglucosamine 2-epimerase
MKRKVMTIVGTRPEIIKLSRVIATLDRHTRNVLVHTGQNYDYELNEIFFNELGIRKPSLPKQMPFCPASRPAPC